MRYTRTNVFMHQGRPYDFAISAQIKREIDDIIASARRDNRDLDWSTLSIKVQSHGSRLVSKITAEAS